MSAIRNYSNTVIELKIANKRLITLLNRKDELFNRICMPASWKGEDIGCGKARAISSRSPVEEYFNAVNTPSDKTGMSLVEEIDIVQHEVDYLTQVLQEMSKALMMLDDVESKLYCAIVIAGKTPTAAVAAIAAAEHMSVDNIWKTYYPAIKDELRKVKRI